MILSRGNTILNTLSDSDEEEEVNNSASHDPNHDYTPPKIPAKTPVLNQKKTFRSGSKEAAIVSPVKAWKLPNIVLSNLCQLCLIGEERVCELEEYCANLNPLLLSSESEESGLHNNSSSNNGDDDDDYGPIYKLWAA